MGEAMALLVRQSTELGFTKDEALGFITHQLGRFELYST